MNTEKNSSHSKDEQQIERLVVRALPAVPPSHSHRQELRERVLAAHDAAHAVDRPDPGPANTSDRRWTMTRSMTRVWIPLTVACLVCVAAFSLLPSRSTLAFEKLVQPLITARTARCDVTVTMDGQPPMTFRSMFRGTVGRQENEDMDTVQIFDQSTGRSLALMPSQKKAQIMQAVNRDPNSGQIGFLQSIRDQLLGIRGEEELQRVSLGEQKFVGRDLIGYRVTMDGMETDIWGDPETGLPHSVVSKMAAFPGMTVSMTDFEFDIDLDEELFSLTPPAGYTVTRDEIDVSKPSEADLIDALRKYTDLHEGKFPDAVNIQEGIGVLRVFKKGDDAAATDAERDATLKLVVRGFTFPSLLGDEADGAYAGKGLTRDAGAQPIFWYRPDGKQQYRVVRADLSVVEAAEAPQVEGAVKLGIR